MASSSHLPNIAVSVSLQALATPGAGFGIISHFVDQAEGAGNALGGARYIEYADSDAAVTSQAAGDITVQTLDMVQTAFLQPTPPSSFRVVRVNTGGAETLLTARTAYELLGLSNVYCYTAYDRVVANQKQFADSIEADVGVIYIAQVSDVAWLTAGLPAAWGAGTSYATMTQTHLTYHDTATEWSDIAVAARWLAFDPDLTSAPGEGQLGGVADYATFVTETQRGLAQDTNSISILGTYGSTDFWIDNVVSGDGRPFYERLTADWFIDRLSVRLQTMHQREGLAGRKVLVATSGQAQVYAVIKGLTDLAERTGHFTPGQVVISSLAISAADRSAQRLRFTVEAMIGISTRIFNVTANFSTTPVIE